MQKDSNKKVAAAVAAVVLVLIAIAAVFIGGNTVTDGLIFGDAPKISDSANLPESVEEWKDTDSSGTSVSESDDSAEADGVEGASNDGASDSADQQGSTSGNTGASGSNAASSNLAKEYVAFVSLSAEDQQAFFESFSSNEEFFTWFNEAKAAYDKENEGIEVDEPSIDISKYAN